MSDKPLIILVEDDVAIAELIRFNLTNEGFEVADYRSGAALFQALPEKTGICLFILDLMLPGMDGFEICRRIRSEDKFLLVPVIMLTARGTESDKVKGLEAGADDYITKPFGIREFLARVAAQVRRYHATLSHQTSAAGQADKVPVSVTSPEASVPAAIDTKPETKSTHDLRMEYAGILLDDVRHRVYSEGKEIEMTNREYELLKFLMQNRGVAYSRDDLLNHVWGYEYSGETRTVDVHIRQLRRKIERDDSNPVIIETVRGRGYRFCE
jgi:two-component system, OmpR family, alkaline phosphatase synthesis response regulator PhoP